MPEFYTPEQILGLAPNPQHIRTSRSLARADKWRSLGHTDRECWGEFPLKNKDPLRVALRLSDLAFTCTCTGRIRPCTHVLALLQLKPPGPANAAATDTPPDWVLNALAAPPPSAQIFARSTPTSPTQMRGRQATIMAGLQELKLWLHDLVHNGLGAVRERPVAYWAQMANRLVDARVSDLGDDVAAIGALMGKTPEWPQEALRIMGRLYLLIQGFEHIDNLSPLEQADLRAAVGWYPRPVSAQDLSFDSPIHDQWHVLGQRNVPARRRAIQRIWLWGQETARFALLVNSARTNQPLARPFPTGAQLNAEVEFYPGTMPVRGQIVACHQIRRADLPTAAFTSLRSIMDEYNAVLTRNPWLRLFPVMVAGVTTRREGAQWLLVDAEGYILPLPASFEHGWHLAALAYAGNLTLFGEWDGTTLTPLTLWNAEIFLELHTVRGIKDDTYKKTLKQIMGSRTI